MTILEAAISIAIASLAIAASFTIAELAAKRVLLASLEAEAVAGSEAQLARVGADLTLRPGEIEGGEKGKTWRISIRELEPGRDPPFAFVVNSQFSVSRSGEVVSKSLSTLRLRWDRKW